MYKEPERLSYCPSPYLQHSPTGDGIFLISPCLLDSLSSLSLLLFVVITGFVLYLKRSSVFEVGVSSADVGQSGASHPARRTANTTSTTGADPETEPLLPGAGTSNVESSGSVSSGQNRQNNRISSLYEQTSNAGLYLSALICLTYLADLTLDFYHQTHPYIPSLIANRMAARTSGDVVSSFAWISGACLAYVYAPRAASSSTGLSTAAQPIPIPIRYFWTFAFVVSLFQLFQWIMNILFLGSSDSSGQTLPLLSLELDRAYFILFIIRFVLLLLLLFVHIVLVCSCIPNQQLNTSQAVPQKTSASFWAMAKKLSPFLWPNTIHLRLLACSCFLLLICARVVNVLVPMQYKVMVDALSESPNQRSSYTVWLSILLYSAYRFLQGGSGVINTIQNLLWIPVGQFTTREISVRTLEHLHALSLRFHIHRKTGDLLRTMDRGTSSISSLLSYLVFNIFPVFVDIAIAVVYFVLAFDVNIGLIVFVTMVLYIIFTVWITEWRTKFRREMNELDSASRARAVDSLLNFESVKYYNNEGFEVKQFESAILKFQSADWKSNASLNVLNTAQNLIITIGLIAGLSLCAKRVLDGELTTGDFVSFLTYLLQLYQPLNWFGTYYRVIQQSFIDMEKLLDIFDENDGIQDAPGARSLKINEGGGVIFDHVDFGYEDDTVALHDITFQVPAGQTVALVGPSGSGKSTIFRLLFRFFNVQSGKIMVDHQDISRVTQASLRAQIGVVPQDTVLFNDTIRYNIRYGNIEATDEEVEAAAKAAQIHDRILTFPEGYETMVGERGLRLSGGEKQRVAIARTLLKNPRIILLDEATSALDNTTERLIQDSIRLLSANRTTLVIAHRLSTVVDADRILVVKEGRIVESGTHDELLGNANGVYYQMWMRELDSKTSPNSPNKKKEQSKSLVIELPVSPTAALPTVKEVTDTSSSNALFSNPSLVTSPVAPVPGGTSRSRAPSTPSTRTSPAQGMAPRSRIPSATSAITTPLSIRPGMASRSRTSSASPQPSPTRRATSPRLPSNSPSK